MKKRHTLISFLVVFVTVMLFLSCRANVYAKVSDNTGSNLQLSTDTSIVDITLLKTSQTLGDDLSSDDVTYEGYNLKLKIKNTYTSSSAIYVDFYPLKINGQNPDYTNRSLFSFSLGSDNSLYTSLGNVKGVRVNKDETVVRTAHIPYDMFNSLKAKKIKRLTGYIVVCDMNGNSLIDKDDGTLTVDLENSASDESVSTGGSFNVSFSSSDNNSISGRVTFNVKGVTDDLYGGSGCRWYYDVQNTTAKDYRIKVFYGNEEAMSLYVDANSMSSSFKDISLSGLVSAIKGKKSVSLTVYLYEGYSTETTHKTISVNFARLYDAETASDYSLKYLENNRYRYILDNHVLYLGGDELDLALINADTGEAADSSRITWKSTEEDIAVVDNDGRVSSLSTGVTIISATMNGKDYTLPLEVKNPSLTITPSKIAVGSTQKLSFKVLPDLEDDKDITFTSEIPAILAINGMSMTGVSPGVSKVTATYKTGAGNNISASTYVKVEVDKTALDNSSNSSAPTVKPPTIGAKGNIYVADGKIYASLASAKMSEYGYDLNFSVKNLGSSYMSYKIQISSINGLKFHNYSNYGGSVSDFYMSPGEVSSETLSITPSIFSQVASLSINEIRGIITFSVSGSAEEEHEFIISPGSSPATSYERVLPSGKTISVNSDDIGLEITSITDQYDYNEVFACINFLITNKSTLKRLYLEGNVKKINGNDVLENLVFIDGETGVMLPGEKMYGRFTIPSSTYMRNARTISSMDFDLTIRDKDNQAIHDEMIHADNLNVVSSKEEILYINGYSYLTAGDTPCTYDVYDDVAAGLTYTTSYSQKLNNKNLKWATSDPDIITVSTDGTVTPIAAGYAILTAVDKESRMGNMLITVDPPSIRIYQRTMYVDTIDEPTVIVTPSTDANRQRVTIGSNNPDIIEAKEGYLVAKKAGTATVTASYPKADGTLLQDTCVVTVKALEGLTLNKDGISMPLDNGSSKNIEHLKVKAVDNKYYADDIYEATWTSSNNSIVTVIPVNTYVSSYDNTFIRDFDVQGYSGEAIVIPKAIGEATITVSYGGKTDTCLVCVTSNSSDNDNNKDKPEDTTDPADSSGDKQEKLPEELNPGSSYKDPATGASYVLTKDGGVRFESVNNPKATKVVVPDYIQINGKKYPVTSISNNAFKNNKKLKNLVVGKNVTTIGSKAFQGCKNLTNVDLKASKVSKIQAKAFSDCKKLKTMKVNGNTLKSVSKNAFSGSPKKVKVTIYAKSKKVFNDAVKKLTKGGLKKANFKFKKRKK